MSTRAVIGWLLVAVALGVAAILLIMTPRGQSHNSPVVDVGDRLIDFRPGDVKLITVQVPGRPKQTIERAPAGKSLLSADAEWQLRAEPGPGEKAAAPWPLSSSMVQGLLRSLAEAKAVALPGKDANIGDHPIRVDLTLTDGVSTWLLSDRTLAGTGLVRLEPFNGKPARHAIVREELIRVFTSPGPSGWRDRAPLAGISADASRIKLTNSTRTLLLARQEGKWSLREPVAAPANPAAVKRLLADLGQTVITDFLDDSPAAATLANPTATILLEADRRTIDPGATEPRISTDALTLTIGGAAGPGLVYARVGDLREVILDGRSLTFSTDPAAYIWPHPTREARSNIGVLGIKMADSMSGLPQPRSFRRVAAKWVQIMPSGDDGALSDREQRDVEALALFLTGDIAQGSPNSPPLPECDISLTPPADLRPICTLRVASLADATLENVEIGLAAGDKLVLKTGPVYRTYASAQIPALLQTLPRPPEAAPPATR